MSPLTFGILAALVILSSIAVILWRNPIGSALSLVFTLLALAVLYFLLDAPFVGILQILVYAGAVMVLFIFVIMLINLKEDELEKIHWDWKKAAIIVFALAFILTAGLVLLEIKDSHLFEPILNSEFGSSRFLAKALFTRYLLSFEMVSFIILAAIIGAIVLARRGKGENP